MPCPVLFAHPAPYVPRYNSQKTRSGKIMGNFSSKTSEGNIVLSVSGTDNTDQVINRKVKILHQLTQPADHPISIYHPEGEYLKGLVLYVE